MTFSVRKTLADASLAPFEYEDAAGKPQVLPHAKTLSPDQAMRIAIHGDFEGVLNEIAPGQGTALANLPMIVIEPLLAAWFEHSEIDLSGAGLGKPPKSSPSSTSTRAPSKRTSRSAASRSRK